MTATKTEPHDDVSAPPSGGIGAYYEMLERSASAILLIGMICVIALTCVNFFLALVPEMANFGQVTDYSVFQSLFDKALAAIIAIELAHSVYQSARGQHGLLQVRIVVLIGILAVVRKFVLIELETASGALILGLAAGVLALGVVYALTHWIEARMMRHPD